MHKNDDFFKIVVGGVRSKGVNTISVRPCSCGSKDVSVFYEGVEVFGRNIRNPKFQTTIKCGSCGIKKITSQKPGVAVLAYNIDRDREDSIIRKYYVLNLKKDVQGKYCMSKRKTATLFPCICNPHSPPELYKMGSKQYIMQCSSCREVSEGTELPDGAVASWNKLMKRAYEQINKKVIGAA